MLPLLSNLFNIAFSLSLSLELIKVDHDLSFLFPDNHIMEHCLSILELALDIFLSVIVWHLFDLQGKILEIYLLEVPIGSIIFKSLSDGLGGQVGLLTG